MAVVAFDYDDVVRVRVALVVVAALLLLAMLLRFTQVLAAIRRGAVARAVRLRTRLCLCLYLYWYWWLCC